MPTLKGLKNNNITPAATLDKVPCKANPIARPAAPKTAIIEVVLTPNWAKTATIVTTSKAYLMTEPATGGKVGSSLSTFISASLIQILILDENQIPIIRVTMAAKKFNDQSIANWMITGNSFEKFI